MSADDEDVDTTRKTVKTFVPAYQKDAWKRHADDLDMSQSEFVRTMVQAGRRDFDIETTQTPQPDIGDSDELEERVLSVLSTSEHLSWEDLVEELTNDIEDRLDKTIQQLQTDNRIRYSGRHGGYALTEGNDGN
jgi:hypothetical protein